MHPRATIEDIAQRAGVSTATVSRVINRTAVVAPETEAKVQAAVAALNYRSQAAAQVLASRRTNTIGLLINTIGGEFFSPLLRGVKVNNLCRTALLLGATEQKSILDETDLKHVIRDLEGQID